MSNPSINWILSIKCLIQFETASVLPLSKEQMNCKPQKVASLPDEKNPFYFFLYMRTFDHPKKGMDRENLMIMVIYGSVARSTGELLGMLPGPAIYVNCAAGIRGICTCWNLQVMTVVPQLDAQTVLT
ncbi:hypothetical protein C5167_022760 [Papaver somniferum]|uniref:Uncharacterized protein n=1 Tax=Papaver somniferum TaxID=3469 RepID=A0A4Y7JLU6_PAPSO|nr:hypothetical protein C5167_022760 [Papaver somniferum]